MIIFIENDSKEDKLTPNVLLLIDSRLLIERIYAFLFNAVTKYTGNTKSNNIEKPVTVALDFKQCRYVLRLIADNNLPFV